MSHISGLCLPSAIERLLRQFNAARRVLVPAWLGLVCLLPAASLAAGQDRSSEPGMAAASQRAFLDTYCVACHNNGLRSGQLTLDAIEIGSVGDQAGVWEKVVSKLRTRSMPPAGMLQPDDAARGDFLAYLESRLDRAAAAQPTPGRPAVQRLNRTEYTNAVRDLLAVDTDAVDIASFLPADDASYGFDNIGDALTVSPTLMEAYMSASRRISRLAIGDPASRPVVERYEVPKYIMQDLRMTEDLPFGSRGGTAIRHHFPADGEYGLEVRLQRNASRAGGITVAVGLEEPHEVDLRLDGRRIQTFTVGGIDSRVRTQTEEDEVDAGLAVRIPVQAGTRVVGVTLLDQTVEPEGVFQPKATDYSNVESYNFEVDGPAIGSVTISGPYDVTGVGDTASRRRIFVCHPENATEEEPCAGRILTQLARRAYRRPVAEQDVESLMDLYRTGRDSVQEQFGFERGVETAVRRILVDPEFLFRIERDPVNAEAGAPYRISDLELASRLSFFLWSSIPDDELLEVAERGALRDPATLEDQVRRMLRDDRSRALVDNFAGQWLYLRNVQAAWPNPEMFPDFVANLRDDFQRETELFIESMLGDDRRVTDLLAADYTFLNERLARHYGIAGVAGNNFRRVTVSDENRKGLRGQGSVLMVTSYATRTAPTIRGKWLLENILGAPPPPPPANVPSLDEAPGTDGRLLTVREQLEAHRVNPACAGCHSIMDPLGFALENFDATGKWRTTDGGHPVDASGVLPDGTVFEGPAQLRQLLLRQPELLVHAVAEKLMTYALGRGVEYYDAPAIRKIVRDAAATEYRWSSVILGIVNSVPFQMRSAS